MPATWSDGHRAAEVRTSPTRFDPPAADALRRAIREAGGVEVFAIGDTELGRVTGITVTCRGTESRVPALLDRPRAGQVVIHNHPSGDVRPSEPDLDLARIYGDGGVGVVIVDNDVTTAQWVVEPHARVPVPVDEARLAAFFEEGLPRALPGWEPRPQQAEMARAVARALGDEQPLLCEAGTGTGKSLAYLVPAALWALANDSRVVVSTYTRSLQAQLVASDLPLLAAGGIEARCAVLQGRNNYLCRRRLELALPEADEAERQTLEAIAAWSETTADGSLSDLPLPIEPALWDRLMSDAELTLSIRCPHYASCHYYRARRAASGAHVLVVNHALLLTDLALRAEVGRGFLPRYERVIVDEAHHLEDAATSVATDRLTAAAVRRALRPLQDTRNRRGALTRLVEAHCGASSRLPQPVRDVLFGATEVAQQRMLAAETAASTAMDELAELLVATDADGIEQPRRVTRSLAAAPLWGGTVVPLLRHLGGGLTRAAEALDEVCEVFEEVVPSDAQAQPLLDVRRARRRLASAAGLASAFLSEPPGRCRWVEPTGTREPSRDLALCSAPIEVGPVLQRILWTPLPGTTATSATLTVAGRFSAFSERTGLPAEPEPAELVLPSPFDHANQALLCLPRDLPPPESPAFLDRSIEVVIEAVETSDGGAFVLCTSHAAVRAYSEALRDRAPDRPILAQGTIGRAVLLDRFRADRRAVLVGTDSFWEGVSVRGEGLRLVLIPRLPFRVPTEPLVAARHERIEAEGRDPFRVLSLPEAVLKLRQGYGRLLRAQTDRGAVVLLDRRIHDRLYGQIILRSLPPARRATGPWRAVRAALAQLYEEPWPRGGT